VLAAPGSASGVAAEIAAVVRMDNPQIEVRLTAVDTLTESLPADRQAVVVPLVTWDDPIVLAEINKAVAASGSGATVTEALGPHPLLAEALHLRLAEAGLARADRIRMMSMVTAADGVILATRTVDESAEVTSVLLASRLAVPVVAAPIDDPRRLAAAAASLRGMGSHRPALSPCVLEMDGGELAKAAADAGAEPAAPLGAHPSVAQLAVLRYVEALEAADYQSGGEA